MTTLPEVYSQISRYHAFRKHKTEANSLERVTTPSGSMVPSRSAIAAPFLCWMDKSLNAVIDDRVFRSDNVNYQITSFWKFWGRFDVRNVQFDSSPYNF